MEDSPPPSLPPVEAEGRYFDGTSARPHPVSLRLDDRLRIDGSDLTRDWNPLDLRAGDSVPPLMRVGPAGAAERVEFSDAALAAALAQRSPDLHRREEAGSVLRLVLWSVAAGVSVLLVALFGVPHLARVLAPLVPDAVESRLGAAVEPQVLRLLGNPPACAEPAGRAALDRLVARLVAAAPAGGALPADLAVGVRRHGMANALALPGARVILLSNLIARATSPDEVAAILAHELGHVGVRDPTRSLIRSSGTSFLLSLVLGDLTGSTIVVAVGEALLSAGYSRDAERAADAYAVDLMGRAGGNGAALADILERIAGDDKESGSLDWLRSHPVTRERAAAIRAQAGPEAPARRIMPPEEWAALKGICPTSEP
ncbi:M48 family metallopeptidase [Methylobacterium oryzihabitans]|uniref:M48 family metallopeptidase n=1 Tax=Methylobacterium oryzihabitans TaxID=2499852 RepID=A0A437PH28_9HYPH|nr:M48 family metallopeptidase [Methylobacterium oryzihabitans]RVU21565.1 M48 family metallopeptidase [Methylobacterium oryzihabitans]